MKSAIFFIFCLLTLILFSQDAIDYKKPPKEIYDLVMAKPTPTVSIGGDTWMLIMERSSMPGIEELAQPELRIAGLRINPNNFGPSRSSYILNFRLKNIKTGSEYPVTNLPQNLKAENVRWSSDENKIAFTSTSSTTIDLYVIDAATKKATKWNKSAVNLELGNNCSWIDNNTILYPAVSKPLSMAPLKTLAPKGPVIQENLGKVAAAATYQDLIKSPYDEALFEFYATTQLVKNQNGIETKIGNAGIYDNISISPDRKYLLFKKIDKPFSYLVPSGGFPSTMYITDINGKEIKMLAHLPSSELAPKGFDNTLNAPGNFNWMQNEPSTLMWIEPLDSGMVKKKMDYHDIAHSHSCFQQFFP